MQPITDPRIPSPEDCVLQHLLDRHARERGNALFAIFESGVEWSYARVRGIVRETAAGLAQLGIRKGDHVAVWLPNGEDALRVWFAINYLGAVCVPIKWGLPWGGAGVCA